MEKNLDLVLQDKSKWGDGPWVTEPDRLEWRYRGLPCLIVRNTQVTGALCGYVGVPPKHRLYKKFYGSADAKVSVHGGLTYSNSCTDHICHVPRAGEPKKVWWFGFDCAHFNDVSPRLDALVAAVGKMKKAGGFFPRSRARKDWQTYKTMAWVKREVQSLARQLLK